MKHIIAWGFCIVFFCAQSGSAGTITVGPGRDYASIQAAIDAATAGDTVVVYPGTYFENVHFKGKSIVLRSSNPTDTATIANTIIDAKSSGTVVTFAGTEDSDCVLTGFTVRNGYGGVPTRSVGCGIRGRGTLARIESNVITDNDSETSAAGGIDSCNGIIRNNRICRNSWGGAGGLSYCNGLIENNTISDNLGATGGLQFCQGIIRGNVITGNSALSNAQGLYNCFGLIENNTIKNNGTFDPSEGGSVALLYCEGTIRANLIIENDGDALMDCDGAIQGNLIARNEGTGLQYCDGNIQNNIIAGNQRGLVGCHGTIQNNTVADNAEGIVVCFRATILNCIVWGNGNQPLDQMLLGAIPTYSCIQGWTGGDLGNTAADPVFLQVAPGDRLSTYVLAPSSPCIDAGNPGPQWNDFIRPPGQGTERNDMGAYGGPHNQGWLRRFLVVRAPNGGEIFGGDTQQEIRWESSPGTQKVNVYFTYRTNSVQTQTLATGLANMGTMRWQLPAFAAEDCSIRVVDADDPASSDTSDVPFRIVSQPPTFQVQSPNGGESYFWGNTIPIRWTSTGASHWVGIHQTTDGGKTWNLLVAETPNDGEYLWPAPHVNSDQCRVSVFDVAIPAYDMSDGDFWVFSDPTAIRPNFRITAADFYPAAPTQIKPGDPLVVSALVENLGLTSSSAAWFEVWGSRTGGITLDQFLCDSVRLSAIPGKGSFSLNMTKPLASIPDGPYSVVYVVDRPDEVTETWESDNRFVVPGKRLLTIRPPTGANLTIEGFQVQPNPLRNYYPVTFGGWVRNTGAQDSGPFWIEFWGSTDRIFPRLDFFLCESKIVPNLPAGQSIFLGYYDLTLYQCPTGTFMAGVYVDRPDAVNETDERDNYAFVDGIGFNQPPAAPLRDAEVHLLAGPDLVVAGGDFSPGAPTAIAPGGPIRISTRIENRGTSDSGPFWLEFWGSKLGGLSLNEFIAESVHVWNIPAGQASDVNRSAALYSMPDGPYTFTIVADRMRAVADANPRNNRLAVAGKRILTIRPQTQANLRTENFAVTTTTLHRGQGIPMSGQVRNVGAQDSGPFWIEFWGSFNQMYPDLNFYLCNSIYAPNLAAGAALDLAANPRTLYSNLPTGPCMILCFPDRPDFIAESDESDNVGAIAGCLIAP